MSRPAFLIAACVLAPRVGLLAQTVSELRTGEAAGEPGEVVEVPLIASFSHPACAFSVSLDWDGERLSLLGWSAEGTASRGTDPFDRFWRQVGPGVGFVGLHGDCRDPQLAPGEDVLIAKVRFRILATAAPGEAFVTPVASAGNVDTVLALVSGGPPAQTAELWSASPEELAGSSVHVAVPRGPRPVGDLSCEQVADRVHLSFTLTEPYDRIVVARDGIDIATLPGDATGYEASFGGLGLQVYTVTAWREAKASYPVSCEVTVRSPAAPPVTDLTCTGGHLRWSNPAAFDRITLFRNGESLAELDGSAESYDDPEPPDQLTVYTVVTELRGYRSPEVNCLEHALFTVEAGDVQVSLEANRVLVPIYVTNPVFLIDLAVLVRVDRVRFRVVDDRDLILQDTVADRDAELVLAGIDERTGLPSLGLSFDLFPPVDPEKLLAPGLRQHAANLVLEPLGDFRDGDWYATEPVLVSAEGALAEPGGEGGGERRLAGRSFRPDLLLGGEIRFGEGLPGVEELRAEMAAGTRGEGGGGQAGRSVRLTWRNGAAYDAVRIERNGAVVAEVPGETAAFIDAGVPEGVFTYKVLGLRGGETSFPRTAFLTTVSPPGTFLRGDATRDGHLNLADPLRTLEALFRGGARLPCEDAADANDDGSLNLTDAVYTLQYLFRGGVVIRSPGTRYPWFDPTPDGLSCRM